MRSKHFARAERTPRLLTYVIEWNLAGTLEIKETMIALKVFGRDSDSTIDSLVRVEARRLRTKVGAFYRNEGKSGAVHIEIPKRNLRPNPVVSIL